jgi:plastocyanin
MKRALLAFAVVAVALAVSASALGRSSTTKLNGTVGPGFTISLKMGGKTVKSLNTGTYKFVIADKSNIHDFSLKGPINKHLTSVSFVGNKTVKLTLKKGKYTYYCSIHPTMKGTFTVK